MYQVNLVQECAGGHSPWRRFILLSRRGQKLELYQTDLPEQR
jgi:hypothetical protein